LRPIAIDASPQLLKLLQRNSEMTDNLEKQRSAYFAAPVNRNGDGAPVRVIPALVTSCLPRFGKTPGVEPRFETREP